MEVLKPIQTGVVKSDTMGSLLALCELLGLSTENDKENVSRNGQSDEIEDSIALKGRNDEVLKPSSIEELVAFMEVDKAPNHCPPLPKIVNMPGVYGFDFDYHKTCEQAVRYSEVKDTLYFPWDVPFLMRFTTTSPVPPTTMLRIMFIFAEPEHSKYDVQRCPKHAFEDFKKGIKAPDHILRADPKVPALYVRDNLTLRRSLIVPFQSSKSYSDHRFRFVCLGSCVGGMNDRSVRAILTLEDGGVVIGRRTVGVKVCPLPSDETKVDDATEAVGKSESSTAVNPSVQSRNASSDKTRRSRNPLRPKNLEQMTDVEQPTGSLRFGNLMSEVEDVAVPTNIPPGPPYCIYVDDRYEYEVLQRARKCFQFCDMASRLGLIPAPTNKPTMPDE